MTVTMTCWCCDAEHDVRGDDDPWEGRLDGYCYECSLARCDAYPGECPTKKPRKAFWRHERPGSYTLARVLCFFFGHDASEWYDDDGDLCRGDCHRCWA